MKRMSKLTIYLGLLILAVGMLTCSDSETKLSPLLGHTNVILNLGLPPENPTAFDDTIWNKIRKIFVRDAFAQTAPASFGSVLVRVTGPDIGTIEQEFGPFGSISLNVPSGSFRQFEVIAYVSPTDPSAALSFRGTTTANLPEGETVNIPVIMGLNETKIVAPDNVLTTTAPYQTTRRVVIFNDMGDAGFSSLTQTEAAALGLTGGFVPYGVSFDSRGRIFIANNSTIGMIRIDNINGTNFLQGSTSRFNTIAGVAVAFVVAVTVDRINNLVYFATSANILYKSNLDGTSTQQLALPGTFTANNTVTGIDIDSAGMLYIVGRTISAFPTQVIKYNPNTQAQIGSSLNVTVSATPSTVFDIRVQGQYIYIANVAGAAGNQIQQLSFSNNAFSIVASNGTRTTTPTGAGQFFGASRFIAIRNDRFIVMDCNQGSTPTDFDRVVSFNDLSFGGWTTYGSFNTSGNGDAVGRFRFFSQC